ncbi:acyltransferase 3 [Enterobacter hormaechei]|uniref:acyltransferase family protein n=1 Tax=Enterobacter hormaechei TaxID=158836 RepID=UPI000798C469|nr:acyltransferase [Enterobacter hormaechei]SAB69671.1 acyltransferase 3 [Enterobacter hormaechei]
MNTVDFVIEKGNNNLDLVRILLAISVIYGHGYFMVDNHGSRELLNQLFPFTYSGSLAVKVFFFISGMLVTNSLLKGSTATSFVISRFFRIMPAFVATIFITAFILGPILSTYDFGTYFSDPLLLDYIKSNPLTGVSYKLPGVFESNHLSVAVNGSLWTIPYEVRAYIGLLALYMIIGRNQKNIATIISILIICIPIFDLNKYTFINFKGNDFKLVISCFSLGAIYAINQNKIPVNLHIPAGLFIMHYFINDAMLSQTLFFFSACTLCLWFSSLKHVKRIKVSNDISYGVYLWGFVVQQILASYLHDYGLVVNQALSIIITIAVGYISFIYIEKPSMLIGNSLKQYIKYKANTTVTA